MNGVLQFINDVAFEHITAEDDNCTVHPCSLRFTFREGRWERTTKLAKNQCRRVVKCMTCEKALHVAQAMEALGLALQAFTYAECVACETDDSAPHTCGHDVDFTADMEAYDAAGDPCDDMTVIGYAEALSY